LDAVDFSWFSVRWSGHPLDMPSHSYDAEIRALHSFIIERTHEDIKLIIWLTDSESGCYSINRANCSDPIAYPLLLDIYHHCEICGLQLLALWVPREQNNLSDYLSHLAAVICRDSVAGVASL